MARPATIRHLHSSGGVTYRRAGDSFEVALIATKNKGVWTLPKGLIDRGEGPEMAALREIGEETGLKARIITSLGERSYWFFMKEENVKCRKTVSYFLLECIGGSINDYGWEVEEARWFSFSDAFSKVTYRSDKEMLEKAHKALIKTDSKSEGA